MKQSTKVILLTALLLIVLGGVGYLGRKSFQKGFSTAQQIIQQTSSPEGSALSQNKGVEITIDSPRDGATVSTQTLVVSGRTTPAAEVAVNDQDVKADSGGNFSASLTLNEGENEITVIANDENGNYSQKDITVILTTNE